MESIHQVDNDKGIQTKDLSCIMLAEYLIHLFNENKQVNTINVHRSAIARVLKMLNPPTSLQEDTIHNILRTMSILRPRSQDIHPRWHLSVVLKDLMKPPFIRDGSDRNISLELLSYKTAFLIALATGSRGSELVALSSAEHITFSKLPSGAKHVSVWMVPKFIPKNARPDTIPKSLEFPCIAPVWWRTWTSALSCPDIRLISPLKELCGLIGGKSSNVCPPLPPGHGCRYRTSGPPSSGRRNSLVITGSFSSYL